MQEKLEKLFSCHFQVHALQNHPQAVTLFCGYTSDDVIVKEEPQVQQYGLSSFQVRDTKLDRFLAKKQLNQRKKNVYFLNDAHNMVHTMSNQNKLEDFQALQA